MVDVGLILELIEFHESAVMGDIWVMSGVDVFIADIGVLRFRSNGDLVA